MNEINQQLPYDIELFTQLPNSPDLNILDLGFFAALEKECQKKTKAKDEMDVICETEQEYWDFDPVIISNKVWITHMQVMNKILKCDGQNTYELPHMGKDKLIRENRLPTNLPVHREAAKWMPQYFEAVEEEDKARMERLRKLSKERDEELERALDEALDAAVDDIMTMHDYFKNHNNQQAEETLRMNI